MIQTLINSIPPTEMVKIRLLLDNPAIVIRDLDSITNTKRWNNCAGFSLILYKFLIDFTFLPLLKL